MYENLFNSLVSAIRGWIQDKIDSIHDHHAETLEARDEAEGFKDDAATSASNAATSANDAAGAAGLAVQAAIDDLVDQAPETLDTLSELADALGNDPNFATTMASQIGTKASTADVNAVLATKADTSALTSGLAGKANTTHTHPVGQISATGTASSTTFLRGDNTWATPPDTTYPFMSAAYYQAGTDTTNRTIRAVDLKGAIQYHGVAQASSGSGLTLWAGNQSAYDALPSATKNAAGFVAIISG